MKKIIQLNSVLFLLLMGGCSNHPVQEEYSQETKPNPLRMLSHDINDTTKQEIQVHADEKSDSPPPNYENSIHRNDEKTITFKIKSGEEAVIATRKYLDRKNYPLKSNERIRFDNLNGDIYLIQLYEGFPDHISSVNWFEVNRVTGEVVPMFDF
jgi:hypothetical protein